LMCGLFRQHPTPCFWFQVEPQRVRRNPPNRYKTSRTIRTSPTIQAPCSLGFLPRRRPRRSHFDQVPSPFNRIDGAPGIPGAGSNSTFRIAPGRPPGSFVTGAVGTAVDRVRGFGTLAYDPTPTMGTEGCQLLNGAFEAIGCARLYSPRPAVPATSAGAPLEIAGKQTTWCPIRIGGVHR
jgi:hypothetical protein